jgi:hypothetical protein
MSTFPNSPKLVRGGLVLVDPDSGAVRRVITLQYNPDQISRTLQVQATGDGGAPAEALRLKGPAIETIKLEAELDATDQLEFPDDNENETRFGLHPQIAALEALLNPDVADLMAQDFIARIGTIEIAPVEGPLTLFVWSAQRVLPVRITDFSVTEEAFDPALNPIRAKVSLGMRVLSAEDLGFDHRGGAMFLGYLQRRQSLAKKAPSGALSALGLGSLP